MFNNEVVAKIRVRRFSGLFWPILRSFLGGNIRMWISPPKKERKIGSKEPENRLNLSFATTSKLIAYISLLFLHVGTAAEASSTSFDSNRILYLMQSGQTDTAFNLYKTLKKAQGHHNDELLQQMAVIFLEQGYKSGNPEIQLLTIFGAGISTNEKAYHILAQGLSNPYPQIQLVSLNFLATLQNDQADEYLQKAMAADNLLIRLEAAYQLAAKKAPGALAQIESLMNKVPAVLMPIFPQFYGLLGDAQSTRVLKRLLTHADESVRIETILTATRHGRDDFLPSIRTLATHHETGQQEACAYALGELKDESSLPKLNDLSRSPSSHVRLAALRARYLLGQQEVQQEIAAMAKAENLYAIQILGEIKGSQNVLAELVKSQNLQVRFNAALTLLELRDSRCLTPLCDLWIKDTRDLGFTKLSSPGKTLHAWKVIPSSHQRSDDDPLIHEISLNLKEESLYKALDLPQQDFLSLANALLASEQNALVPVVIELLENLQTPAAISLLKQYQQKAGAPLIRNYCNLALYLLQEPGPYADNLRFWIAKSMEEDLIRFRPMIPWEMRETVSTKQLTPEETSRLLISGIEALASQRDEKGIDLILEMMQRGNSKNKYALAGLLMRAIE